MESEKDFLSDIFYYLPPRIRAFFLKLPPNICDEITEIRLRADKPVSIVTRNGCAFITSGGRMSFICSDNLPVITGREISDMVTKMCGYSVYSHQSDLVNGFITLKGGCRVGICGTAVIQNGAVTAIRELTSVNIRVAREIKGCSDALSDRLFRNGLRSIIVAGAPMSGKTTVLKDLVRKLSDGLIGSFYKCAVIDERGELSCLKSSECFNADILSFYPKPYGIMTAVRTLSPDIIFCDELGSESEANEVLNGMACGVKFIVTAHASSLNELYLRHGTKRLLESGLIDAAVFLDTGKNIGKIKEIFYFGAEDYENCGSCDDICGSEPCRDKQGDDNNGERQGGVFGNLNAQVHKDIDIVCIDPRRQDIRQPS